MAKKKYDNKADAQRARKRSNLEAQRRYRTKQRQLKRASRASQLGSTMRDDMNEEATNAVELPDASVQDASCEVESAQDARRGPGPPNAPFSPLEHIASIEKALDRLLVSVKDLNVQRSMQESIARIEPKFKELVSHVRKPGDPPVQRVDPIVPSMQYHPYTSSAASGGAQIMTEDTILSLGEQIQRFRTQCAPLTEIKLLSAQLDRATWTL
ncbi:hypothetical protein Alg130_10078 [Pyrenophora tritici-repentis]|nr:hypothetical protein Alg130_10078 [Pyrenophora tritici-repentis]